MRITLRLLWLITWLLADGLFLFALLNPQFELGVKAFFGIPFVIHAFWTHQLNKEGFLK